MHHRSHDWGVSVQGGLHPGGLCHGGSPSRERGLCPGGLCLGGLCRESLSREVGLCLKGSLSRKVTPLR